MLEKWIYGLAKARYWIIALWVAAAAASILLLPNLQDIVRQSESRFVPASAESMRAQAVLEALQPGQPTKSNAVIVYVRPEGLTPSDKDWLKQKADELKQNREQLGIVSVLSAFDAPGMADKFESKDGTSALLIAGFPGEANHAATHDSIEALSKLTAGSPAGSQVHLTGSGPINKDFMASSQEGLRKTELLTVVLVLGILLVVFRSPVAPFVPLLTIGLSLVITRGLVAWAAELGMPVSSFTESFLIAVLFGAGTDYCILLIQRFREELAHGLKPVDAMVRTVRTVGLTVLFSGSTVLIAFFLIGFAQFGLYQSAVGVAIGMAVTLLAGLTLTPALMVMLGSKLFWPAKIKAGQGHGESRLWSRLGSLSSRRPAFIVLAAAIALAPIITLFDGKRSFDDVAEIDPTLGAVAGFQLMKDKFGAGEVFPVSVTLTSSETMRTPAALAAVEAASTAAAELPGVQEVRSASRPLGKPIMEAAAISQLPAQALAADAGLKQALDFYMSPDGLSAKIEVVLADNPYSGAAMSMTDSIRQAVKMSLSEGAASSAIKEPQILLAGTTAQYTELKEISKDDFLRTGGLVLAGIFLVVALLLRSWTAPLYMLLSLVFNYFITMGLVEFIFVGLLDYPGLSWTVSFFVFLINVALGVDYGIFLMARFKEEHMKGAPIAEAMRKAMSTTGGVIVSAAVIMGGTFAALMGSGVDTLVQIGAGILIGLALYSTVFMGLVVPALANLLGRANFRQSPAIQPGTHKDNPSGIPLMALQRTESKIE